MRRTGRPRCFLARSREHRRGGPRWRRSSTTASRTIAQGRARARKLQRRGDAPREPVERPLVGARAALARPRRLAGARGRHRAAPPAAHPGRVHRQPVTRAPHATHDRPPARRDAWRGTWSEVDVPDRMPRQDPKIDVETGHLVQMVTELLDLSRIEGGATQLLPRRRRPRTASSVAAIDRLGLFAERQERDPAKLTSPPTANSRASGATRTRLGQVLVNLLHNAVKFSPARQRRRRWSGARDGELLVEVATTASASRAAGPGSRLRALLQGGQGARPGQGRHGTRPGHRATYRRGPRRADLGRQRRGQWVDVQLRHPHRRRHRQLSDEPPAPRRLASSGRCSSSSRDTGSSRGRSRSRSGASPSPSPPFS